MKAVVVALSIIYAPAAAILLVSTVAMALGTFIVASPHRAAKIWGSQRFNNLAPERRASFVRWYRVFGIVLFLAGAFSVVDSMVGGH